MASGDVRQATFAKATSQVRSFLRAFGHKHTHVHTLLEYPLGKPLEAKLLKEFVAFVPP